MNNISDKVNSAINLFNSGEKEKGLIEINLLVISYPKNMDLLLLHAKMSIELDNLDNANKSLSKILKSQPSNSDALKLIYINYLKASNYDQAKKYIDTLLSLQNTDYELLRDKAYIEYIYKNYSLSEKFINKALQINKEEVFGLNILGLIYLEKKETLKAIIYFEKAISINGNYTDSYNNLGKCYIDLEELNKAYLCFKKAYKLNPGSSLPIMNIANILSLKDKNKLAIKFYEKVKEIDPNNKNVDENINICNFRLKNFDWVENKNKKQLSSGDLNYDLVLGYSYLLLNKKRFEEGFNLFDARLKTKNSNSKNIYHKNLIIKLDSGHKLEKNKKNLIVKEGGVGDEILFSSMYTDLIEKNYSNIYIECDVRLLQIFKRSFKKNIFYPFGHFSSSKNRIQEFENVIYSGSLTKVFRKNEKDFKIKPYLKSLKSLDSKFNLDFNNLTKKKKIGISWRSVINIYGGLKSLKINNFEKLFSEDRMFFNLQYGDTNEEINQFKRSGKTIHNFEDLDLFNDFESLISILKNLDVFITVSNSTAHFAGALGVPTILICPKKSSTYYYWDYNDGKTPWYNSISIIQFKNSIGYTMDLVNDLIDKI